MKTSKDPRHLNRIKVMQDLFAWEFNKEKSFETETAQEIAGQSQEIDQLIMHAAPAWPIEKINKIDLAVLRQAVFELRNQTDTPEKVVIDEAVEIAKEFGSEASPGFVNGVLGKLVSLQNDTHHEK